MTSRRIEHACAGTLSLFLVAMLLAGPMSGTVPLLQAAPATVYVDDDYTPATPGWGYDHFATIQNGIDAVDPGGTVQVAAGTYHESAADWVDIQIAKSLDLIGAGSSSTTVELNQYNNPAGAHTYGVAVSASDVLIQGVKLTKRPSASYACATNISASGGLNNLTLADVESGYSYGANVLFSGGTFQNVTVTDCNIHHSYTDRCFYQSPGTSINTLTVTNSHFDYGGYGNPTGDPIGFNLQGPTTDLTITGGTFNHNVHDGIYICQVTDAVIQDIVVQNSAVGQQFRAGVTIRDQVSGSSNIQIVNPAVTNCGGWGIVIEGVGKTIDGVSVIGGTVSNAAEEGVLVFASGGASGRVKNVTLDGVTIAGNRVNVLVTRGAGSVCSGITVKNCLIANAESYGVSFSSINVTGSAVNLNAIVGNGLRGIVNSNSSGGDLDAANNWWGCNYGPGLGGAGCSTPANSILGDVDADPWLVLGLDVPVVVAVGGGTGTLTADLTRNSSSANTSSLGHIPDGATVTFAGTLGSVNPPVASTTAGKAASTFTAGATPGTASVSATVDDQTACDTITVGTPTVRFAQVAYVVQEDAGTATIDVRLNAAPVATATVDYATSDGTAQAGTDYVTSTGALTFAPGQVSQSFTVTTLADAVDEPYETVALAISDPVGADLGTPNTSTLLIMDVVHGVYLPLVVRDYRAPQAGTAGTIHAHAARPKLYIPCIHVRNARTTT